MQLWWCHYTQLSLCEAGALQLKDQHVRLIKQIKGTLVLMPSGPAGSLVDKLEFKIHLSFLHPVQTLWVPIRDPAETTENNTAGLL